MKSVPPPVRSILEAIGNTPLVQLQHVVPADAAKIFLKLEYYNPTGSYKDRMALAMISEAEKRGDLKPGMRVIEYTGGSTGSSLAMVCAAKGYLFNPLSSDAYAREKLQTMRAFGADLELIASDGGRITPELFNRFKIRIEQMAAEPGTFYTDQFHNTDAIAGYKGIGEELIAQMNGGISVFCGGVGTGGMLVGVSCALKAAGCTAKIVALEPAESPVLTTGKPGPHRVEGIGVGFWPPHLKAGDYDEVRVIDEDAARQTARRLAAEEGILSGTSTGLNVAAAILMAREYGPKATIVTVACDTGLKYLGGDLFYT